MNHGDKVQISGLVGEFVKMRQQSKYNSPEALKAMIRGTSVPAEQSEPGNPYSRSLNRAIELLDQGVPMDQLVERLKKEGL